MGQLIKLNMVFFGHEFEMPMFLSKAYGLAMSRALLFMSAIITQLVLRLQFSLENTK